MKQIILKVVFALYALSQISSSRLSPTDAVAWEFFRASNKTQLKVFAVSANEWFLAETAHQAFELAHSLEIDRSADIYSLASIKALTIEEMESHHFEVDGKPMMFVNRFVQLERRGDLKSGFFAMQESSIQFIEKPKMIGAAFRGAGVVFMPLKPMAQAVHVKNCTASNFAVDWTMVPASRGERCEGVRAENALLLSVTIRNLPPGGTANGIITLGKFCELRNCKILNAGYAGIRGDANQTIARNCEIGYDRKKKGRAYRFFACNHTDRFRIIDCRNWCNLAVESHSVFDTESSKGERVIEIQGLTIDHKNYQPGPNNHVIKIAAADQIRVSGVKSNVKAKQFLNIFHDNNKHATKVVVRECSAFGGINFQRSKIRNFEISDCLLRGGFYCFDNVNQVRNFHARKLTMRNYTAVFGNDGHREGSQFKISDSKWISVHQSNIFLGLRPDKHTLNVQRFQKLKPATR